jgi:hypothetical protein
LEPFSHSALVRKEGADHAKREFSDHFYPLLQRIKREDGEDGEELREDREDEECRRREA